MTEERSRSAMHAESERGTAAGAGQRAATPDLQSAMDRQTAELAEQRRTISELQTPVIQVWDGILALPIVGSVDTARAQEMTERLLEEIVRTGSELVVLDITGVLMVDTAVARHLLETVAAARLLGAEVLIVGLSTRTAMTLVHLGVDLGGVTTRTTMAKGLELAFARLGYRVVRDHAPVGFSGANVSPEG